MLAPKKLHHPAKWLVKQVQPTPMQRLLSLILRSEITFAVKKMSIIPRLLSDTL